MNSDFCHVHSFFCRAEKQDVQWISLKTLYRCFKRTKSKRNIKRIISDHAPDTRKNCHIHKIIQRLCMTNAKCKLVSLLLLLLLLVTLPPFIFILCRELVFLLLRFPLLLLLFFICFLFF